MEGEVHISETDKCMGHIEGYLRMSKLNCWKIGDSSSTRACEAPRNVFSHRSREVC